jgi:diguanylate cyclase (GGDEF)-like protein/PAS domain S-box-containing protein
VDSPDRLRAEYEALLQFLYLSPVGILRFDRAGCIEMANPAAARLLVPLAPNGAFDDFFALFDAVAPELRSMVEGFAPESGSVCDQHRVFLPRGERNRPAMAVTVSIVRVSAQVFMAVVADIMATIRYEAMLHQSQEKMRAFFESVQDYAMYTVDTAGRIDDWNESIRRLAGFGSEEVRGRHFSMFYPEDERERAPFDDMLRSALANGWHKVEGWRLRSNGARFWGDTLITPLRDGDGRHIGYALVTRDITDRKRAEEALQRDAATDFLTGLYNRRHFVDAGAREFARARRDELPLSLVAFDIDHFKRVNDTWGHAAGDRVLVELARLCGGRVRGSDVLARLGGEEFALLLPGADARGSAAAAEKLREAIADLEVDVDGTKLRFTCSFGVAVMTPETATLDALLADADAALYAAKAA